MITVRVTCDECHRYTERRYKTLAVMGVLATALRHNGWSIGVVHRCPICAGKNKREAALSEKMAREET